ncbi:ABC transporter ATP-binding protein [Microcella daejeonensis]|uniref:ABC transporter ATP-binding protein/permease n=1 Tax=Microcella daejeonensis TaxID=2994971 RepID=UPI00226F291C|nr:ABC transporter ATP-binding protein [Microcella daejeonensis]WAB84724.1 ABC transporter ATP-binding protein [Microcella daejeonensis]
MSTTIIDGVEGLDPYYTRYLPQLITVAIAPAAIVVLVAMESVAAGIVLGSAVLIATALPRIGDARLLRRGRARWQALSELTADYTESFVSIPLLRAFGAGERAGRSLSVRAEGLRRRTMDQLRVSLVDSAVSTAAMHLGVVGAALVMTQEVLSGAPGSLSSAMVVLLLARESFRPVTELAQQWHAGYLGLTAVDGIDAILSDSMAALGDGARTRPVPPNASLALQDVTYRYPDSAAGISDISFAVDGGETIAVVGASGAGKSTIARLLDRDVEPGRGAILIDGIDIRAFADAALRSSLVVVPQDTVLFTWSVHDNLALHRPSCTEDEVRRAARIADIDSVIARLPYGYQTTLTENGEQLSGGQRQRFAIARALVADPPILILDEATSALDVETERRVLEAVLSSRRGRTTVLIAHRQTAVDLADRVITLADGRVVADARCSSPHVAIWGGATG